MKTIYAKIALLLFTICQTVHCSAQVNSSGDKQNNLVMQEWMAMESFDGISVTNGITLFLRNDKHQKIEVQTSKKTLKHVKMKISDGLLEIKVDGPIEEDDKIFVFIKSPRIKSIKANRKSIVRSQNTLMAEDLHLTSSRESHLNITANAKHLYLDSSGGSELIVKGHTEHCSSKSKKGGSINTCDLIW
ncbi:MAG: DUF2807 domain-containing protein [Bacteroidota bacterium]